MPGQRLEGGGSYGRTLDGGATVSHRGLERPFWLGGREDCGAERSGSGENSEEAMEVVRRERAGTWGRVMVGPGGRAGGLGWAGTDRQWGASSGTGSVWLASPRRAAPRGAGSQGTQSGPASWDSRDARCLLLMAGNCSQHCPPGVCHAGCGTGKLNQCGELS